MPANDGECGLGETGRWRQHVCVWGVASTRPVRVVRTTLVRRASRRPGLTAVDHQHFDGHDHQDRNRGELISSLLTPDRKRWHGLAQRTGTPPVGELRIGGPANPQPGDTSRSATFTSTGTASIQFTVAVSTTSDWCVLRGTRSTTTATSRAPLRCPRGRDPYVAALRPGLHRRHRHRCGHPHCERPQSASGFNYSNVSADLLVPIVQLNDNVSFFKQTRRDCHPTQSDDIW